MSELFLRLISPFPIHERFLIGEEELAEARKLAFNHNLLPLLYAQVQKHRNLISQEKTVSDFLEGMKDLYMRSVALSARQESVENETVSLLQKQGISSMVIKGNALAREIYDDPNCRISSDVDILIRRSDAAAVDAALREVGYLPEEDIPLAYCLSRIHHASYYHLSDNMPIEMHWGFGVPYFFKLSSEEIWKEIIFVGPDRLLLSPEMVLIMLLIHHHSHSFRDLKILVDIFWAFHKFSDVIEWPGFGLRISAIGLAKTAGLTLEQLKNLWPESGGKMKACEILDLTLRETGCRVPQFLLTHFRMNISGERQNIYKDKLVARFVLDSLLTTLHSYFKTLFPDTQAIKELYNDRRDWALPFNYLKFIRWRLKEWMGV